MQFYEFMVNSFRAVDPLDRQLFKGDEHGDQFEYQLKLDQVWNKIINDVVPLSCKNAKAPLFFRIPKLK